MPLATYEQVDKKYQELQDWRAARIAHLTEQFNAGIITRDEFLKDVKQALI